MESELTHNKFNLYQTPLTEELKNSLPKEVWLNVLESISSVEFIKRLIAPEEVRGYAKDKPRETKFYNDGRIDVDLTNPHILEDMDFFRERAIFYEKNGKYTNLTPNPNPKSAYAEFWKEEQRRWKYGLVRPSDGEWIPGQLYFYWNYSPIWLVEIVKTESKSTKQKGERLRKFPKPWLGDYLFYHYMQQARDGGLHGKLLKTRGVGFPQPNSENILTPTGFKKIGDVKHGDFLISRKGKPTKVLEVYKQDLRTIYELEFSDGRKVRSDIDHLWTLEYKNKLITKSVKNLLKLKLYNNNQDFTRYYYKIPDIEPVNYSKNIDLSIKPYLLGFLIGDGNLTKGETNFSTNDIEILDYVKECIGKYEIKKHATKYSYGIINPIGNINYFNREIKNLGLNCKAIYKFIPKNYLLSSIEDRIELLKGLMDSDGCISKNGFISYTTSSSQLKDNFLELCRSLGIKCSSKETNLYLRKNTFNKVQSWQISISPNFEIFKLNRKLERQKLKKHSNSNVYLKNIQSLGYVEECTCFTVDNDEHLYLTTDFIPTHNSFKMGAISPCNMYVYPGSGNPNFHLASEKTFLAGDKGIWGKVVDTLDWIAETTPLPRMRTVDRAGSTLEIQLGFKDEYGIRKGLLSSVHGISLKDNPDKARGIRGPLIHYEEDGLFPNLEKAWNVNLKAVEDGNVGFGFMLAGGTGGVEGGSFEGSEKLFYQPEAYEIYGIPNVFDKNATGDRICGFFWGGYMNRNSCYDENIGEPDVIKALIEIELGRFKIKYNSQDPNAITQKKAEEPITPQEAIMRTEGTVFPVSDLKEYLEEIMIKRDSFLAEHYVGELIRTSDNKIKWKLNSNIYPIRSYDKDTSNREGCLEIFEMPKKSANGEIPVGRYIFGIDPIDADAGTSLFSIIGLDTFTDRIVCEYTGRPRLAEEAYEIALRVIEFYNGEANYESNLKGLFSYFDKKNSLHRLCDVPQVLKDMDMIKNVGYGNLAKGTRANVQVNKWGRKLHADWMLSKAYSNNEDEVEKLNLHTMRGIAHIEEAIKWNSDGNFDRISAAGMLFILREDKYKRTQSAIKNQNKNYENLANDNFFNKNYNTAKAMSGNR